MKWGTTNEAEGQNSRDQSWLGWQFSVRGGGQFESDGRC